MTLAFSEEASYCLRINAVGPPKPAANLSVSGTDFVGPLLFTSSTSSKSSGKVPKFVAGDPKMQSSVLQFPKRACSCDEKDVEGYLVVDEEEPRRSPEASTTVTKKARRMTS
jgi:hypothetical protein